MFDFKTMLKGEATPTAHTILKYHAADLRREALLVRATGNLMKALSPRDREDKKLADWLEEGVTLARELEIAASLIDTLGVQGK